jgi:IPT/TIG domain
MLTARRPNVSYCLQMGVSMADMVLESRGCADWRDGLVSRGLSAVCILAAGACVSPPALNSINPTQAPPGTTVALSGSDFASGMTAQFGTTPAATVNVSSANDASTAVPVGLSPGVVNVTVTVGGRQSNAKPFTVMAISAPRFWRGSSTDIQAFRFTSQPMSLTLAQTHGANLSPGAMAGTVGLVRTRDALLRATSSSIDVCTLDNVGLVVNCASSAAGLSGVASDLAMFGALVVRATNSGLELFTYDWANKTLTQTATIAGSAPANASTEVAVAVVADGFPPTAPLLVVRATDRGIDVFNVSNPAAPTLAGSHNKGEVSKTGVDVAMLSPTRVVRAHSGGIDVYTVSASVPPTLAGSRTTAFSASRVSIDADSSGLAVRSYAGGVEVLNLSGAAVPAPVAKTAASSGADLSGTGTSITLIGDRRAARVTDDTVEVWDVSGTDPLPPPARLGPSNQVTLSPTGTAAVVR